MINQKCVLIFALAILTSSAALAQEYFQLPEQTTVLRLRPQPLLWTPAPVTVIDSQQLNETYRSDLGDLEGVVPGLVVDALAGTPGGAAISMRGVGAADTSKGMFPVVDVRVDGVDLGTPTELNQLLFDVNRIEVDRGPQGVWEGAPAPGGVINLYRSKPTGKLSVKSHFLMGEFERKRFDTVINVPLATHLAGKFTLNWRRGGQNLINNIYTGRRENEDQLTATSLSLLWRAHFAQVQYTYDNDNDNSDVPALLNLSSTADLLCANSTGGAYCSQGGAGRIPETGSYTLTTQGFSNQRRFKAMQHTLHVKFNLKGFHFTSITALRNTFERSDEDLDGTSANFYSTFNTQGYHQLTQEINAWRDFPHDLSLAFGAYMLNSHYSMARTDYYILKQISAIGDIIPVANNATRVINAHQERRLKSVFADLSFRLSPKWKGDVGARGDIVRTYLVDNVSQPNPASGAYKVSPAHIVGATVDHEYSDTAGLAYKVDPTDMIYMRYSHSFRPGGFNDLANSAYSAGPYQAEHVDAYEVGLKSHWFDNHVHFSYVFYREDYRNKLERYATVMPSGRIESVLRNTSHIRTFGDEIQIAAVPIDNLLIHASLNHSSSHYISYRIPNLTATGILDLHDTIPALTPPDQYRISALYTFPWWRGEVRIYGAYRFTTSYWSDPNIAAGHVNTFAVMDFSIDYSWNHWRVRFFSDNFNDRRYLTNAVQTFASQVASLKPGTAKDQALMTTTQYDEPRFNGIQLIYDWSSSN